MLIFFQEMMNVDILSKIANQWYTDSISVSFDVIQKHGGVSWDYAMVWKKVCFEDMDE